MLNVHTHLFHLNLFLLEDAVEGVRAKSEISSVETPGSSLDSTNLSFGSGKSSLQTLRSGLVTPM